MEKKDDGENLRIREKRKCWLTEMMRCSGGGVGCFPAGGGNEITERERESKNK
jgi:acyl CoA:acetate/3-ketoacid CoA transferase alpha subunit